MSVAVPALSKVVDSTSLDEDDVADVSDDVCSLASKYTQLGTALGIPPSKLKEIQSNHARNSANALTDVLLEWLKKNYNVRKFGEPSWKKLVEAVAKPSGGGNRALAEKVAARHTTAGGSSSMPTAKVVSTPVQQRSPPASTPAHPATTPSVHQPSPPQQQPVQHHLQQVHHAQQVFIQQYPQSGHYQPPPSLRDELHQPPPHESTPADDELLYSNAIWKGCVRVRCDGYDDFERFQPIPRSKRGTGIDLTFGPVIPTQDKRISKFGYYPMKAFPHGVALIINNEMFANHKEREGTCIDEINLITTFRTLGYIVEVHRDRSSAQILDIMARIRHRDHSKYDSFVCCILSHGNEGHIYGSDSRMVPIEEVTKKLNGDNCGTLAGKPKLFFLQACRGKNKDKSIRIETDSGPPVPTHVMTERGSRVMTDSDISIPSTADFFFGYATPMGTYSWRDVENGSWYITELCHTLCKEFLHASLKDMMMKVSREVGTGMEYEYKSYRQAPETTSRLNYDVFF